MTRIRIARRATIALFIAAISADVSLAQDGYRTPPDAITKILDSPAPQVAVVSTDRKWLLITTSDVQETTIAELAEPTLYLAGRPIQMRPKCSPAKAGLERLGVARKPGKTRCQGRRTVQTRPKCSPARIRRRGPLRPPTAR